MSRAKCLKPCLKESLRSHKQCCNHSAQMIHSWSLLYLLLSCLNQALRPMTGTPVTRLSQLQAHHLRSPTAVVRCALWVALAAGGLSGPVYPFLWGAMACYLAQRTNTSGVFCPENKATGLPHQQRNACEVVRCQSVQCARDSPGKRVG